MTECKEIGFKPIPGANHKHPTYHYEMVAGDVYRKNADSGEWEVVRIDKGTAAKAEQAFNLHFVKGRTVAEFTVDDVTYGQPIPLKGEAKAAQEKKARRAEKAEKKSIAAQVKASKAVIETKPAPAPTTAPKAEPKKDPPPKRAKGLRKGGYGLD